MFARERCVEPRPLISIICRGADNFGRHVAALKGGLHVHRKDQLTCLAVHTDGEPNLRGPGVIVMVLVRTWRVPKTYYEVLIQRYFEVGAFMRDVSRYDAGFGAGHVLQSRYRNRLACHYL